MGRKNPSNLNRFLRPVAGYWFLVFGFWFLVFGFWFYARSVPKKMCRHKPLMFFRPIRSSPKFAKADTIVWMIPNERVGAWMPLGRVCVIGFGRRGSAGTWARGVCKGIPPLAQSAGAARKKLPRSGG